MRSRFNIFLGFIVVGALLFAVMARAQTPISPPAPKPKQDTAMIFEPSRPLIQSAQEITYEHPNTWGFTVAFSDYGFGGGMFLGHSFNQDIAAVLTLDVGSAEGSREVDLLEVNKVNRIFVLPLMASIQYRVFRTGLSDNFRPYVALGAGPVLAMTTPYSEDFFTAFGNEASKVIPGGFIGFGANFGNDPKGNFGASLRYFIIPYPGSLESTTTESLTNLSGLFLTASYGFSF
jgi:hypothetical protein